MSSAALAVLEPLLFMLDAIDRMDSSEIILVGTPHDTSLGRGSRTGTG